MWRGGAGCIELHSFSSCLAVLYPYPCFSFFFLSPPQSAGPSPGQTPLVAFLPPWICVNTCRPDSLLCVTTSIRKIVLTFELCRRTQFCVLLFPLSIMFLGSSPISICNSDLLLLEHVGQSTPFYLPTPQVTGQVPVSMFPVPPTRGPRAALGTSSYVTCACLPVGTWKRDGWDVV